MTKVWVGYYEGNTKSKRVLEKCGFRYQWKSEGVEVPLMHKTRTGYGEHVNEYRVFYMNHEICTFSRNSGQGNYTAEPSQTLLEKYQNLGSPYYTIDYAELESGEWKALETGDGQVSGLSDHQDYQAYFRTLFYAFREQS